jgi:hypothetical protein
MRRRNIGHSGLKWRPPIERVCFSFSGAFKTYTTPWEGRSRRFSPNNEWVGRGMSGSQPGEDSLAHPQETYMSSKLFLFLACFILPLRDDILKKPFWGGLLRGMIHLQYLLWADKGQQTLPIKGSCRSYFSPLGLIWTQGVWIIVQHS